MRIDASAGLDVERSDDGLELARDVPLPTLVDATAGYRRGLLAVEEA